MANRSDLSIVLAFPDSQRIPAVKVLPVEEHCKMMKLACLFSTLCLAFATGVSFLASGETKTFFSRSHIHLNENHDQYRLALLFSWGVAMTLLLLWNWIKPTHVPKSVPGPPRTPGLGYLPYAMKKWETWPSEVVILSEKYNRTWGGPVPNVGGLGGAVFFIVDEQCLRHILQDSFNTYEKGDSFRTWLSDFLGNGIFAADGETWKVHRQLASHYFSRNLLRQSCDVTKAKLAEMIQLLDKKAEHKTDNSVDIQDLFFRMTIDSISSVAFGVELDSINREKQHEFALAFDEAQALCHSRVIDPTFRIKRFFQLTKSERRISACLKTMNNFTDKVIQSKRRTSEEGGKLGPDLISRYLETSQKNNEVPPTNKELRDIVMNFVLAGRDTTACALSWTFYELSKKPQVVDNIIEEVNSVCGLGEDAEYTYENMGKLTYTHAVVMEALRLHPSVPGDAKYAVKDDVLPDGTFIPKGSMVNYYPYYFGRSKRIWGESATDFQPERFLNAKEPSSFLYPVFNAGYRLCLGKPMAIMNMKLTLAHLLPRFQFVDANHHTGEYKWTLVRSMKGGFPVQVTRRVDDVTQA